MLNFKKMKISKIFSIPGRIRLKVEELKCDLNYASGIEIALIQVSSVNGVTVNVRTGNILVKYDQLSIEEAKLIKQIEETGILVNKDHEMKKKDIQRGACPDIFREEKLLSKRLTIMSAVAASVLFITSSSANPITAFLLGFPGIIYITSYLSLKYTLLFAEHNEVLVRNIRVIREIQKVKGIIFHCDIIIDEKAAKKLNNSKSYMEIENMVANDVMEDPVHPDVRSLVKDLRKIGIHKLSVLCGSNKTGLFIYAVKTLGLNYKEKHQYPEIIIIKDQFTDSMRRRNRIILSFSGDETADIKNIHIKCYELNKIPWLINTCLRSSEFLTRSQAAAVSINIFGTMLIFMGYLNLGTSIIFYFLNLLGNIYYLKHKILRLNKELHHGEQRQFINA